MKRDLLDYLADGTSLLGAVGVALSFAPAELLPQPIETQIKDAQGQLKFFGMLLFFAGMLLTMQKLRSTPKTLEGISERLDKLDDVSRTLTRVKESVQITSLVESLEGFKESSSPVPRKVAAALLDALNSFHAVPGGIRAFEEDEGSFYLEERYLISEILRDLARHLPDGGQWKGITCLKGSSWDSMADPAFKEFDQELRDRAASGKLTVSRIFVVSPSADKKAVDEVEAVIAGQKQSGIDARMIRDEGQLEMSVVYADRAVGICALESQLETDALLKSIRVISPNNERFDELAQRFDRLWERGS